MSQPQLALERADDACNRVGRRPRAESDIVLCGALSTRGQALAALNRHEEAIAVLEDANKRMARGDTVEQESILANKSWLLGSRKALGQTENALAESQSIVDLTLKLKGPESPASLSAHVNLVKELARAKRFDEAASLAATLPALAEKIFPPGHPNRALVYLAAANALASVKRFGEAEHHGLAAYAAFVAGADDLDWQAERATGVLRTLYGTWPGHFEQWFDMAKRSARVRLMVANVDERATTFNAIRRLDAEFKELKPDRPRHGIAEVIWEARDELAPPGHPRRAAMLANLALVFAKQGRTDRRDQAIELSRQATEHATDRAVVDAIIKAAIE
jgi:tetratricopeptide (TPR) repeat protein